MPTLKFWRIKKHNTKVKRQRIFIFTVFILERCASAKKEMRSNTQLREQIRTRERLLKKYKEDRWAIDIALEITAKQLENLNSRILDD